MVVVDDRQGVRAVDRFVVPDAGRERREAEEAEEDRQPDDAGEHRKLPANRWEPERLRRGRRRGSWRGAGTSREPRRGGEQQRRRDEAVAYVRDRRALRDTELCQESDRDRRHRERAGGKLAC